MSLKFFKLLHFNQFEILSKTNIKTAHLINFISNDLDKFYEKSETTKLKCIPQIIYNGCYKVVRALSKQPRNSVLSIRRKEMGLSLG